jgi:hypothetical protein
MSFAGGRAFIDRYLYISTSNIEITADSCLPGRGGGYISQEAGLYFIIAKDTTEQRRAKLFKRCSNRIAGNNFDIIDETSPDNLSPTIGTFVQLFANATGSREN